MGGMEVAGLVLAAVDAGVQIVQRVRAQVRAALENRRRCEKILDVLGGVRRHVNDLRAAGTDGLLGDMAVEHLANLQKTVDGVNTRLAELEKRISGNRIKAFAKASSTADTLSEVHAELKRQWDNLLVLDSGKKTNCDVRQLTALVRQLALRPALNLETLETVVESKIESAARLRSMLTEIVARHVKGSSVGPARTDAGGESDSATSGGGAEMRPHVSGGKQGNVGERSDSSCPPPRKRGRLANVSAGNDELLQQQMEKMEPKVKSYLERLEKKAYTDPAEKSAVVETIQSMWTPWRLDSARLSIDSRTGFNRSAILGVGGYGIVYKGLLRESEGLKSIRVAVKVLQKEFSCADMKMDFFREASLLHALRHPCILKFYGAVWPSDRALSRPVSETLHESSSDDDGDLAVDGRGGGAATRGQDNMCAMLVTERMTCTAMDAKQGELLRSRERVWQVLLDVAEALEHVHGCGVLHLDVKAENVLLRLNKKGDCIEGRAQLSDFGVSRRKRSTMSVISKSFARSSGSSSRDPHGGAPKVGTVVYMSPELMAATLAGDESYGTRKAESARDASGACDVWSFGVLVCVLGCTSKRGVFGMSEYQVVSHFKDGILLEKYRESICELEEQDGPLAAIATMCLQESALARPTFADVRSALQREAHESSKVGVSGVTSSDVFNGDPRLSPYGVSSDEKENLTAEARLASTKNEFAMTDAARREDDLADAEINLDGRRGGKATCSSGASEDTRDVVCDDDRVAVHDHAKVAERIYETAKAENTDEEKDYGDALDFGQVVGQSDVEAIMCFLAAAEQGHAEAQFKLGLVYWEGQGVECDYTKAVEWLRKAAEAGHAGAQGCLGCALELGQGVGQSDTEAVKWYLAAAAQGNVQAQFTVGWKFWEGLKVGRDYVKAADWFCKAAEAGHVSAQVAYAHALDSGQGRDQSDVEAVKWYLAAAKQGHVKAQYVMGKKFFTGIGVERDDSKSAEWFRKSAEAGDAEGQIQYARAFLSGSGVGQSDVEAFKWSSAAAEQGLAEAQYTLGSLYQDGQGVGCDQVKAAEWLRKSAEAGFAPAQVSYGQALEAGKGVKQNDVGAFKWFSAAAEQGDATAIFNLGKMHQDGRGVKRDDA